MKKGVVVGIFCCIVVSACAQPLFPDSPKNHWAFKAIADYQTAFPEVVQEIGPILKSQPTSKMQIAWAFYACYDSLNRFISSLQVELDELKAADALDIQKMKDKVAHLQDEINQLKSVGDFIAAIQKSLRVFRHEYQLLMVDVPAMQMTLSGYTERVARLTRSR